MFKVSKLVFLPFPLHTGTSRVRTTVCTDGRRRTWSLAAAPGSYRSRSGSGPARRPDNRPSPDCRNIRLNDKYKRRRIVYAEKCFSDAIGRNKQITLSFSTSGLAIHLLLLLRTYCACQIFENLLDELSDGAFATVRPPHEGTDGHQMRGHNGDADVILLDVTSVHLCVMAHPKTATETK